MSSAASVPTCVHPPHITAWASGNTGIPYVWSFDAGVKGPHVAIASLTHGNEYCGAIVCDELLRSGIRPRRGRLSIVFNNVEAFARFDPHDPFHSRFVHEDFNRLWDAHTLASGRTSCELHRARMLRPFYETVDHLIDVHSMHEDGPPLLLCGPSAKGLAQARAMGVPSHVIIDAGHAAGTRLIDFAPFVRDDNPRTAYLIECGQHWASETVEVARACVARFLSYFDMESPYPLPARAEPTVIEVTHAITVQDENSFQWSAPWQNFERVPRAESVLAYDGARPLKTPYDDCYLIMPAREPKTGQTAVRLGREVRG